jgi:hypothetical protein
VEFVKERGITMKANPWSNYLTNLPLYGLLGIVVKPVL